MNCTVSLNLLKVSKEFEAMRIRTLTVSLGSDGTDARGSFIPSSWRIPHSITLPRSLYTPVVFNKFNPFSLGSSKQIEFSSHKSVSYSSLERVSNFTSGTSPENPLLLVVKERNSPINNQLIAGSHETVKNP